MSITLILGATIATMDDARRVIDDGGLAVGGDSIAFVGTRAEAEARFPDAQRIDATGKLMLPGLIDVHAHAGHGLIKTLAYGDGERWEALCEAAYTVASTPEFWQAEARLAALERLRFGVTCGVSLLGGGDTIMRSDDPAYADAHCEGVASIGTRSVVAIGPTRAPHPRTYARWQDDRAERYDVSFEQQLATACGVADRWHGSGTLSVALIYPTLRDEHEQRLDPVIFADACAQAQETRAAAEDRGLVFTQDGHTRGSVRRAASLGLLGPRTLLSHATDLDPDEIATLAETGATIAHNPSAVASILGRCPATELMAAGVTVALGSDATAPDRSADMFRHMQQAMHYHRRHFRDPALLPPGKTLEMATRAGAKALGMEDRIGSLEAGKAADLILVRLDRPHIAPPLMPLAQAICFANGNDVDFVMIDGVVRLQGGQAVGVDEQAVAADAMREARTMLARANGEGLDKLPDGFWDLRLGAAQE
ncbi:amidohydrolase [Paracoccus suum]|uniref:Amidohydrolase n=1 Tax=Paracoccus suum TaxID=2259340 RepID=A0A344PMI9_9RHOB|nr:amidohydrolase family protein [Paracoccus suum]AXC50594.1 amidohydrolase [Paracoccus suum]